MGSSNYRRKKPASVRKRRAAHQRAIAKHREFLRDMRPGVDYTKTFVIDEDPNTEKKENSNG